MNLLGGLGDGEMGGESPVSLYRELRYREIKSVI